MKLIFLFGMPGVGKLTVGRELANLTRYKLFHNHLAVDLGLSLFEFGAEPFVELREQVWLAAVSQAAAAGLDGMIFTFAFDRSVRTTFINELRRIVTDHDGEIHFVELSCSREELERRITDPSRKRFGKLISLEEFHELDRAGAFVDPGIPEDRLTLDINTLSPGQAAQKIMAELNLPGAKTETQSIHEAYADWSLTYDTDRNLTRDLDAVVTRKTLSGQHFKSVLEIGCGTGKNTQFLVGISEAVRALDFSKEMIDRAKARLGETGPSNVSFAVADITSRWPCNDESYDLVTCSLVLEHIKEIDFIFAESSRCLRDGGRLFLCELHPYRQYAGTKANFTRDQKVTQIDSFLHHVSDFLDGTARNGLSLESLKEWWHEEDKNKPPRLLSLMLSKSSQNNGR